MRLTTLRLLGLALGASSVLALAACGGGPATADAATDDAEKPSKETVSDAKRAGEPAPPADYVRSRCTECSMCRVFMGGGGYCSRPACKHHWKDHKRPPQG